MFFIIWIKCPKISQFIQSNRKDELMSFVLLLIFFPSVAVLANGAFYKDEILYLC